MWGIIGEYFFNRSILNEHYIKECLKRLKKSPGEDEHVWNNGKNYQIGFCRLPVRDLSGKGRQPMFSDDGRFCLCLHGEIYNTAALQQRLKCFRNYFKSMTDTEVVLYGLIHLGVEECLELMDGIFAFAFYDTVRNVLILCRDRIGVIPLYVGYGKSGIVFGSQYDHIIQHEFICDFGFDHKGLYHYLYLGYMPENNGVIKSSGSLPHGHYLKVDENGYTLNRYYSFPSHIPETQSKIDIEELIHHSVKTQLVGSVPVGTFLSGGVDSRLITGFASRIKQVKAYTIGVKDLMMDESESAYSFCKKTGVPHSCRQFSASDFRYYAGLHTAAFTEPFADYSSIPSLMLAETASAEITVALSGDGGDELFWGYNRNVKALRLMNYYESGGFERKMKLILSKLNDKNSIEFFRHWNCNDFIAYYYSTLAISGAVKWLPEILAPVKDRPFFYPENIEPSGKKLSVEENMMMVRKMEMDLHFQRSLQKMERATRYFNLEVRMPFLSNAFLDNSIQFNYAACIDGESGKMNLKKVLYKMTGDPTVFDQKKGFTIPINHWMRNTMQQEVTETIMDMPSKLSVYLNRRKLNKLLRHQNATGSSAATWLIWAVYALIKWDEMYNK